MFKLNTADYKGDLMNKIYIAAAALLFVVAVSGCVGAITLQELSENTENYLGEKVTVQGVVSNTVKIGELSGFNLSDGDYSISVSSETLPAEGTTVTVTGTVMKEILIGHYILADSVQ